MVALENLTKATLNCRKNLLWLINQQNMPQIIIKRDFKN